MDQRRESIGTNAWSGFSVICNFQYENDKKIQLSLAKEIEPIIHIHDQISLIRNSNEPVSGSFPCAAH